MSLRSVWIQTLSDGLIRVDQIIGIDTHPTPAVAGKPSRWLLDIVLATTTGSGVPDTWAISALHRTLIQTPQPATQAPALLARLLAQLDAIPSAGVITASIDTDNTDPGSVAVRFHFAGFTPSEPGDHGEYL
ncbi:MAG: hypothetical protein IVW52_18925 [Acidimicrobiales bacterium]|nr:hypothetical protein [Acidimicrobiales bacterium]